MSDNAPTLFERMGGSETLTQIVHEMYRRVLADESLGYFFENVSMNKLQQMQFEFLASALDGPIRYTGAELTHIHRGRGIRGAHFAAFCGHFADAAQDAGVDPGTIDLVLGRLAMYKDKITGDTNVDG